MDCREKAEILSLNILSNVDCLFGSRGMRGYKKQHMDTLISSNSDFHCKLFIAADFKLERREASGCRLAQVAYSLCFHKAPPRLSCDLGSVYSSSKSLFSSCFSSIVWLFICFFVSFAFDRSSKSRLMPISC